MLRRKKSRKDQAVDALGTYLKVKTAGKAAKGAKKGTTASYKVAKRTPLVIAVPVILVGTAAAAAFVVFKLRSSGDE